ncbi:MAG: 3-phosphoserine/phosphohydroxythreonine transaminase [Gammaproteobacteria bacterium]
MQETFYFGAGPATLPKIVLDKIKNELIDYCGTGLSVLELSHRSNEFIEIMNRAENLMRELMGVPDDYAVLLLHGGATTQYSMLPINFIRSGEVADYICTGHWSQKACNEARKFSDINQIDAIVDSKLISIKPTDQWGLSKRASYIHYCENETISGVMNDVAGIDEINLNESTLFCDMTSSILTRPTKVKDFGLIYASAQKNLGVAGLCVVVVRKDLLEDVPEKNSNFIPKVFDYKKCYEDKSLVNTPPTFAIYVLGLMLDWLKAEGGVAEIYNRGQQYSKSLYELIDTSKLYKNNVDIKYRSNVNIPFVIEDINLHEKFISHAENNHLLGLRGHNSVGGVRVSLYNAIPASGVEALLGFMRSFELSYS